MALLKIICWALVFMIRICFLPGKSLATKLSLSISFACIFDCFAESCMPRTYLFVLIISVGTAVKSQTPRQKAVWKVN